MVVVVGADGDPSGDLSKLEPVSEPVPNLFCWKGLNPSPNLLEEKELKSPPKLLLKKGVNTRVLTRKVRHWLSAARVLALA